MVFVLGSGRWPRVGGVWWVRSLPTDHDSPAAWPPRGAPQRPCDPPHHTQIDGRSCHPPHPAPHHHPTTATSRATASTAPHPSRTAPLAVMSAPASSSSFKHASWPFSAEQCKAVYPDWERSGGGGGGRVRGVRGSGGRGRSVINGSVTTNGSYAQRIVWGQQIVFIPSHN